MHCIACQRTQFTLAFYLHRHQHQRFKCRFTCCKASPLRRPMDNLVQNRAEHKNKNWNQWHSVTPLACQTTAGGKNMLRRCFCNWRSKTTSLARTRPKVRRHNQANDSRQRFCKRRVCLQRYVANNYREPLKTPKTGNIQIAKLWKCRYLLY